MTPLPKIMVAPNGARRTKADHPALPVTIPEIVETAAACHAAGADGIHAHVRDADGKHVLDAGLYRELIAELSAQVPDIAVQITTEAVGIYAPAQQRTLVREVEPAAVSVALVEMMSGGEETEAATFYHWAAETGIAVQHILYSPDDLARLAGLLAAGTVPREGLQLLFVLGRYTKNQQSTPADLTPFLDGLTAIEGLTDWAICAFGQAETDCLLHAVRQGGKVRVGFENNLHQRDGTIAADNTARVAEVHSLCGKPERVESAGD